jgi:glucuronosyltransferase
MYKKYFPKSKSTFDKDLRDVSLVFINNHFTTTSPRHLLPNMIDIAGIHVQKQKPLPQVILTMFFLDFFY